MATANVSVSAGAWTAVTTVAALVSVAEDVEYAYATSTPSASLVGHPWRPEKECTFSMRASPLDGETYYMRSTLRPITVTVTPEE